MSDTANFVIEQGSDWIQQLVLQNDDGTLLKLKGCEAYMQVRAFPQSPVVLLDLSTAAGTMTLSSAAAQLNWSVAASTTSALQPASSLSLGSQFPTGTALLGYYDLAIKYPNGQIIRYLSGQILLKLCITIPS